VLRGAGLIGSLAPLLTVAGIPQLRALGVSWLPTAVVGLIFALLGAARTGVTIGALNFLLDVAPADDRPIYIGLTNTLVGFATLTTALGGLMVEAVGYRALFALALAFYLASALALTRTREPRAECMAQPAIDG